MANVNSRRHLSQGCILFVASEGKLALGPKIVWVYGSPGQRRSVCPLHPSRADMLSAAADVR